MGGGPGTVCRPKLSDQRERNEKAAGREEVMGEGDLEDLRNLCWAEGFFPGGWGWGA